MKRKVGSSNHSASGSAALFMLISGPSGVGKDAILERLVERSPSIHVAVTATTRPPRSGEQNGVDYHFVSTEEFQKMVEKELLLEFAEVYGNMYGVPKGPITEALNDGKDVALRTDVQGAETIKRKVEDTILIFVTPPSLTSLKSRIESRKAETAEEINRRLQEAAYEIDQAHRFDHIVTNEDGKLDECADQIDAIIATERNRQITRHYPL
ncbi:MAG: guanylate kinase [SAR202 cluster bacterium]|nr:guanylate kinase [SAR202 cluster bacterium]